MKQVPFLPSPAPARPRRGSRTSGFTLIEILVVLVVFSILAAVAWVQLNSAKDQAHIAAMTADLRGAALYEEIYASEHDGNYFSGIATSDSPLHGFRPSEGITVTLTAFLSVEGSRPGWNAVARHRDNEKQCSLASSVGSVSCGLPDASTTGVIASN